MPDLTRLAKHHNCYVATDNLFQRRARVLQSIWREERGYPMGEHRGMPLGSRLPMPWAEQTLANYLTDTIRGVVRREVLDPIKSRAKLFGQPRIFNDLLSSQPLCFNVFGELQGNLDLATAVFRDLAPGRVERVNAIEFEHSPGRGDPAFLGDRSAFDVYVEITTPLRRSGFIGIEVKYHEDLKNPPGRHRPRYDEVAAAMGCFDSARLSLLRAKPLQQVWRDHMLAGSLLLAGGYEDGFFVFLHPKDNECCGQAAAEYRVCLTNEQTFAAWTLEDVVAALSRHTEDGWVGQLSDRYLSFTKLSTEGS